jgi:hypothetical protein
MAVADREVLRQTIVEWQVVLVVESHRRVVGRCLRSAVDLFGQVVLAYELVTEEVVERVVRLHEIGLMVRADPAVIEVWEHTTAGIVKREHAGGVDVDIRVQARKRSAGRRPTGQPVDAAVVVRLAPAVRIVIKRIGR